MLVALAACTEPRTEDWFEGTVTSVFVVKDVFQNTETLQMLVVKSTTNPCEQADVTATQSTSVYNVASPSTKLGFDALKAAGVVRVTPATSTTDACPMKIAATSIGIVK